MNHHPRGKVLVTILSLHPDDKMVEYDGTLSRYTHAFALDEDGARYFIFMNAIEATSQYTLDDLKVGSQVYGTPISHPKGMRLIEVEIKEI